MANSVIIILLLDQRKKINHIFQVMKPSLKKNRKYCIILGKKTAFYQKYLFVYYVKNAFQELSKYTLTRNIFAVFVEKKNVYYARIYH